MIPFSPDMTVRDLGPGDATALAKFLNQATHSIQYCRPYNREKAAFEILDNSIPGNGDTGKWYSRKCTGAWKAGELIGFIDTAIHEALIDPPVVGQPISGIIAEQGASIEGHNGILRSLVLPNDPDLASDVFRLLLAPVENQWRQGGIETIRAFIPEAGYAQIQAGVGILPAEWREHFRLLTASGYQLRQRFRAMVLVFNGFVEEVYPDASISLEVKNTDSSWECKLYHRRLNQIGSIKLTCTQLYPEPIGIAGEQTSSNPLARVVVIDDLHVDDEWRGQNMGKLLLRRAINDGQHRGYERMLMYLRQDLHTGWSLLAQHGFEELDYRGYSFQKQLTDSS